MNIASVARVNRNNTGRQHQQPRSEKVWIRNQKKKYNDEFSILESEKRLLILRTMKCKLRTVLKEKKEDEKRLL